LNRYRLKMDRQEKCGIAFGEAASMSSAPSRSQMDTKPEYGFGGPVDEKIKSSPRSGSATEPKEPIHNI